MENNQSIEVEAYHAAIKSTLEAAIPELVLIDDYGRPQKKVPTPALVVDLTGWRPSGDGDDSTGMQTWEFDWAVYLLVAYNEPSAKLAVRKLAMRACQVIEQNRFGLQLSPARVESAEKDDFDEDWDAYEVFAVRFTQDGRVGIDAFAPDEGSEHPTELYGSMDPDVGIPHEEDYTPLT